MLLYSDQIRHQAILSLQTGQPLAMTDDVIIDPRKLHITAFTCRGTHLDDENAVLHTSDIREVSELGLITDGADSLMGRDGLVRLEEIIGFKFFLIGISVVDTTAHKLGKVTDFIVDTDSFFIVKIVVKRPLLQALNDTTLTIDRRQIVEITNDRIVVSAADNRTTNQVENVHAQQVLNPFRAHSMNRAVED